MVSKLENNMVVIALHSVAHSSSLFTQSVSHQPCVFKDFAGMNFNILFLTFSILDSKHIFANLVTVLNTQADEDTL